MSTNHTQDVDTYFAQFPRLPAALIQLQRVDYPFLPLLNVYQQEIDSSQTYNNAMQEQQIL